MEGGKAQEMDHIHIRLCVLCRTLHLPALKVQINTPLTTPFASNFFKVPREIIFSAAPSFLSFPSIWFFFMRSWDISRGRKLHHQISRQKIFFEAKQNCTARTELAQRLLRHDYHWSVKNTHSNDRASARQRPRRQTAVVSLTQCFCFFDETRKKKLTAGTHTHATRSSSGCAAIAFSILSRLSMSVCITLGSGQNKEVKISCCSIATQTAFYSFFPSRCYCCRCMCTFSYAMEMWGNGFPWPLSVSPCTHNLWAALA